LTLVLFAPIQVWPKASTKDSKKTSSKSKPKNRTTKEKPKVGEKEMKLAFTEVKLNLKITKSKSAPADMKFNDVEMRDGNSAVIAFATPQFKSEPIHRVPVVLLTDFLGEDTLRHDIVELGYKEEAGKTGHDIGIPRQMTLPKGILYFWTTPTMGSANYYYLQHPQDRNIAIRIGPIAGAVDKEFTIDWASARWIK
tara:strand:- start:32383 stop:32970 length:588 start_codon:yes stop_codon:yes gene_type:complete